MRDIFQGIFNRPASARRRQREAAREAAARNPDAAGHTDADTRAAPTETRHTPAARLPGSALPFLPPRPAAARPASDAPVGRSAQGIPTPILALAGMHASSPDADAFIAFMNAFVNAFPEGVTVTQGMRAPGVTIEFGLPRLFASDGSFILGYPEGAAISDAAIEQAMRENEIENQRRFDVMFDRAHAGTVKALRSIIDTLRARDASQVPEGGITQEHIDERHWDITYKLPALLLAHHLPTLCQGRGSLRDIALFDRLWQKVQQDNQPYPSMLPRVYQHLLTMHGHDAEAVRAALPTLVPRIAHLLETGDAEASPQEKSLTSLIQDAVHHIDGQILYEALGKAWAHLPNA